MSDVRAKQWPLGSSRRRYGHTSGRQGPLPKVEGQARPPTRPSALWCRSMSRQIYRLSGGGHQSRHAAGMSNPDGMSGSTRRPVQTTYNCGAECPGACEHCALLLLQQPLRPAGECRLSFDRRPASSISYHYVASLPPQPTATEQRFLGVAAPSAKALWVASPTSTS